MYFISCVVLFFLTLYVERTFCRAYTTEYVYPPIIATDNTESNDINLFPNNNAHADRDVDPKYINDLWTRHTDREINDIGFWLNQWNNRGQGTIKAPIKRKPSKPSRPIKTTRKPSKPVASTFATPPNGNNIKLGKISDFDLDDEESTAKPSTTTTTSGTPQIQNEISPNMTSLGGGGGGGGSGVGAAVGTGVGIGLLGTGVGIGLAGKGTLDTISTLGSGVSILTSGTPGGTPGGSGGSPQNPITPRENPSNAPKEKPQQNKDNRKNQQDKNNKENEDDFDFDLDDIFDADDFIDYEKFEVKSHSLDDIAVIFASKFKRLEYVSEWLATNLTNELKNLTTFKEKYQNMDAGIKQIREIYGNKIETEPDNDVYNQMLEGYNAGALMESCFQKFNEQIETIEEMLIHFADAAAIVENESFRIKTKIVEHILEAKSFRHQIYKTVGAVRVLAGVSKLRILDCLSPYIPVYQLWRNSMKRLYLEGIQLERDTYRSLNREHYSIPTEWRKVKGTFTEFIESATNELQQKNIDVQELEEPIYNCATNITKYMLDTNKKIMKELKTNLL